MRDEEVEVWKLLIVNMISRLRKKMSAQNKPERGYCIKNKPERGFSLKKRERTSQGRTLSPCGTKKTKNKKRERTSLSRLNEIEPPMSFKRVRKRTSSIFHFASQNTRIFYYYYYPDHYPPLHTITHHNPPRNFTKKRKGWDKLPNEIRFELRRIIALKVYDLCVPEMRWKRRIKKVSCMSSFK